MRRVQFSLLVAAGLALGLGAQASSSWSAGDLLAGWALLGCGLIAWERRPDSREGGLFAAAGAAWFAANLWPPALYLHRGPLVHAMLGHPNGRASRPLARLAVAAAYIDGAVRALGDAPIATFALCLLVASAAVDGWLATPRLRRRAQRNATALTLLFCLLLAAESLGRIAGWDAEAALLHGYELTVTLVAVVLTADLLRRRWSELTGLVVDLGAADAPLPLRDQLARVLGDPSLEVGYRLGETERFVDEAGRPFLLPGPSSDRAVTSVDDRGERIAVLIHDPAGPDDLALLSAVAAVARIAVVNARLQAEARARVLALAASRRRVIDAATAERRRLGAELREGAERRLHAVAAELEQVDAEEGDGVPLLDEVELQLEAARSELRRLAAGLVPLELDGGLEPALKELSSRSPVPVDLRVSPGRLPANVEAGAYFLCAEALTNVAKHACASRIRIDSELRGGELHLAITDDGIGGASFGAGSGLQGLHDRIAALGGRLEIDSAPGRGTRVGAAIPIG